MNTISMWFASHLHANCKSFAYILQVICIHFASHLIGGQAHRHYRKLLQKHSAPFPRLLPLFSRTVENAFHICNFLKSCPSSFDTCETARTCGGPTRSTLFSTKMGAESVLMELRCFSHRFRASWTSSKCSRYAFVRLLVTAPNFRFLAAPPFNGDRRLCSWAHHKK